MFRSLLQNVQFSLTKCSILVAKIHYFSDICKLNCKKQGRIFRIRPYYGWVGFSLWVVALQQII